MIAIFLFAHRPFGVAATQSTTVKLSAETEWECFQWVCDERNCGKENVE